MAQMAFVKGEAMEKRNTGSTPKSSSVTIRIEPRLRYGAEIAARKQRRTLSAFMEAAIEEALERMPANLMESFKDELITLWDVDEADRFVKLAVTHPELLTYTEEVLWKLLRENGWVWKGHHDRQTGKWTWNVGVESMSVKNLRDTYQNFVAVAEGRAAKSTLPTWTEYKAKPEDEIPF